MKIGNEAVLCEGCPLKKACEGPITLIEQHIVDAGLFSLRDDPAGINISLGTKIHNEDGQQAGHFPPHTTREDILGCTGETIDYRYGFLNLKKAKNCGAQVVAIHRFRESVFGSPYPTR